MTKQTSSCNRLQLTIRIALTISLLITAKTHSQLSVRNDIPTILQESWEQAGPVTFKGNIPFGSNTWNATSWNGGLHFENGRSNHVQNPFIGNRDIVVGVHGSNTSVLYDGPLSCDVSSYVNVQISGGGHFTLGPQASLDLINDRYYTRQIWVNCLDSGTFEVLPGFIADRTEGGTKEEGVGSYRFSNTRFISHTTEGLPFSGFPECVTCPPGNPGYNGHLVFENRPGSKWVVRSNDQSYPAAIWIWVDCTLHTEKNITHSGTMVTLASNGGKEIYRLAGAFQTLSDSVTVTKTGPARLVLQGEQAYKPGARLNILEGGVDMLCDATGGWFRPGSEQGTQALLISLSANGSILFANDTIRIAALTCEKGARITIRAGSLIEIQEQPRFSSARLHIDIPEDTLLQEGKVFHILDCSPIDTFAEVTFTRGAFDISQLYGKGIVTCVATSVHRKSSRSITNVKHKEFTVIVHPNRTRPNKGYLDILGRETNHHQTSHFPMHIEPKSPNNIEN